MYTIVGFVKNSQFNTQPIIFTSIQQAQQLKYSSITNNVPDAINGIVVRDDIDGRTLPDGLEYIPINDFIRNIPGYHAQVLTFGLMIGVLVLISTLVIGIFMYILTIQKKRVFGIMKAQGISAWIIGVSVLMQTILLATAGVLIGLAATYLTSMALPGAVPYLNNSLYFGVISVVMVVTSALGSLLSVRAVSKIDPLEAIG